MTAKNRIAFTTLAAALVLAWAADVATANKSIEIRGGPNVAASARLTLVGTEGEAGREITCDITLRRTITSTIPKIGGTLFGKLTGISINRGAGTRSPNCRHGGLFREVHDITPLTGPRTPCAHTEDGRGILTYDCSRAEARLWKLIYDSFQGTLPRILGLNYHIQNFQLTLGLLSSFGETTNCLYQGNAFGLFSVSTEGTITRAETRRSQTSLELIEGAVTCSRAFTFEGALAVTPTLTIRLLGVAGSLGISPARVSLVRPAREERITLTNSGEVNAEDVRTTGFSVGGEWQVRDPSGCLTRRYRPREAGCSFEVVFNGRAEERQELTISYRDERAEQRSRIPLEIR